jgi:hypothetical protein
MIPDFNITISDGVQSIEFEVLAHVTDDDYSWSAEAILRRKSDGALFFASDAGCSCNYFMSDSTVADLTPIRSIPEAWKLSSDRVRLRKSYLAKEVEYR